MKKTRLEIEPAPMALVQRGGARVAVPARKLPKLTDHIVRDTLEKTRRGNIFSAIRVREGSALPSP